MEPEFDVNITAELETDVMTTDAGPEFAVIPLARQTGVPLNGAENVNVQLKAGNPPIVIAPTKLLPTTLPVGDPHAETVGMPPVIVPFPGVGVATSPASFPRLLDLPADFVVRRALLPRFPYALVFIDLGMEVRVLAVAHGKRRPGYWLNRVER